MPGRSRLDFLADIRSLDRNDGGHVPVIAMTAYVLDQVVVDAGFQRPLRKPFAPDQLLAAIDSVLWRTGWDIFLPLDQRVRILRREIRANGSA